MTKIKIEPKVLICDCKSPEHLIIMRLDEDEHEGNMVYLHAHLVTYKNFFKRFWVGLKYAFGYKCRYGNFDEFIVTKHNYHKFKDLVDFIEEDLPETK